MSGVRSSGGIGNHIFELDAFELGEFLDGVVGDVDRYVELQGAGVSEEAARSRWNNLTCTKLICSEPAFNPSAVCTLPLLAETHGARKDNSSSPR